MHFLITAGGTREYIDPVRFISNASTGKMGSALAKAASSAGHKVTLITTIDHPATQKIKIIKVESAAEMFGAVKKHFPKCDCLIMAAAVADYTPAKLARTKVKKITKQLTIKLKPTADILKWAGKTKKQSQIVVGFALEDKALRVNAEKKLKEKNLDMIIANTPKAIAAEKTTVQIKTAEGKWTKIPRASKSTVAKRIIQMAQKLAG